MTRTHYTRQYDDPGDGTLMMIMYASMELALVNIPALTIFSKAKTIKTT